MVIISRVQHPFNLVLGASEVKLLKIFSAFNKENITIDYITERLKINKDQLMCAAGFNQNIQDLPEILTILNLKDHNQLIKERNQAFISDVYKNLNINNIKDIYRFIVEENKTKSMLQIITQRLKKIEQKIDQTVSNRVIEGYKKEIQTLYVYQVFNHKFVESRLSKDVSSFRVLVNEVAIMIEQEFISAEDALFNDSIMPQEKLFILNQGLIPKELIVKRIKDKTISKTEKKILNNYLKQLR